MQDLSQSESLSDQAYAVIEELIVTLALPPGHVFSEAELSKQINIGRTPLREALQRLVADKLVKSLPRKGMMIAEINMIDHMAILETRRVLDRLIVSRAAKRVTESQQVTLKAILHGMQDAADGNDISAFMRLDKSCDEVLEDASRNPFAAKALSSLHVHCRRFWYHYKHEGDIVQSAKLHMEMLEAVIVRDENAAADASDRIMDYMEDFTRKVLELG